MLSNEGEVTRRHYSSVLSKNSDSVEISLLYWSDGNKKLF